MADPARYLLPTERQVINLRRHWAVLAGSTIQTLLLLTVGILLARVLGSVGFARLAAVYFCVFVIIRHAWIIADWYVEKLIVTDKRVLLLTGIVTRKVAIMPLVKVTDLTFNRSATGLLLGYGQFVVETAGQDQALSHIDFVPQPEKHYMQISALLFGGDKGAPGALVTAAQREAEEEAERAARGRWRRFTRRRGRPDGDEQPAASAPTTLQLDAILADRDTLLADRDDPEWRDDLPWSRPASYGRDPADRDLGTDRDRDLGGGDLGDRDRDRDLDDLDDDRYRSEPTVELPRFHEPRRGDPSRGEGFRPGPTLPPPRRPRDGPGQDPFDD